MEPELTSDGYPPNTNSLCYLGSKRPIHKGSVSGTRAQLFSPQLNNPGQGFDVACACDTIGDRGSGAQTNTFKPPTFGWLEVAVLSMSFPRLLTSRGTLVGVVML